MRNEQVFAKKYIRLAEEFTDVVFLEIVGDENRDTRVPLLHDLCFYESDLVDDDGRVGR